MLEHEDNTIFDRLADGELSVAERHELLSSLDNRVDGWRRCALALLEAQTWRSEFKSFVTEQAPPLVVQVPSPEVRAAAPTPLPARFFSGKRWIENSMALAASALVAFGIGWSMNAPQMTTNQPENLIVNEKPLKAADSRDAVTLLVKDDQGKHQRLRLPLVDGAQLGQQFSNLSPVVPAHLRASFRDRGLDVQSKQRFAPLFFEQNNSLVPMVIPVNDTYVVPVNNPVY